MIQTLVFVLAFIGLGVATVAVAMRSGRRRKKTAAGPSRGERMAMFAGTALLILALGLAVPAFVIVNNAETQTKSAPGGVDLTEAQVEGRKDFARNCSQCHALAASNAVGRVGPDLDAMRPPVELTLDAIEKGRARGQGQMPAELLTGENARHVAEYVAAVAGRTQ